MRAFLIGAHQPRVPATSAARIAAGRRVEAMAGAGPLLKRSSSLNLSTPPATPTRGPESAPAPKGQRKNSRGAPDGLGAARGYLRRAPDFTNGIANAISGIMRFDLSDEEATALTKELHDTIGGDRTDVARGGA